MKDRAKDWGEAAGWFALLLVTMLGSLIAYDHNGAQDVVHEDEPGFNCLTMGNRECGPDWEQTNIIKGQGYCVINRQGVIACESGYVTELYR